MFQKLEIGKNVFPDLPPGLVLPVDPDLDRHHAPGGERHGRLTPRHNL